MVAARNDMVPPVRMIRSAERNIFLESELTPHETSLRERMIVIDEYSLR
jgi:hypothetical protein